MAERIEVVGLREFRARLRALDRTAPRQLRVVQNKAAKIVVDHAVPRVPRRTGKAAGSIRAASTQSATRVAGGGARVPYYGWLDFGGTINKHTANPTHREHIHKGRYIWAAFADHREEILRKLDDGLKQAARDAGLDPR